jgi:hypothetical protein
MHFFVFDLKIPWRNILQKLKKILRGNFREFRAGIPSISEQSKIDWDFYLLPWIKSCRSTDSH